MQRYNVWLNQWTPKDDGEWVRVEDYDALYKMFVSNILNTSMVKAWVGVSWIVIVGLCVALVIK